VSEASIRTLIDQKLLTKLQILDVFVAAQREVNRVQDSPAHDSARVVLKNLLARFPAA
jgi:hypothetical protein